MKVLFVQPDLNPPGGGNGVAAWMIQALKDRNEVSLLSWAEPRFEEVNRYFGTSIDGSDVRTILAPGSLPEDTFVRTDADGVDAGHLLSRHARELRPEFDVAVTANNESDLGPPAVQYVHYPKLDRDRPDVDLQWYHSRGVVAAYHRTVELVTGFSRSRALANTTITNSGWTAERLRITAGIDATVLHPPIVDDFSKIPWTEREDTFVCVGRISPEKRVENVVEIVERLRANGHRMGLRIVGTPDDDTYAASIRTAVDRRRAWATLHENVSRRELCRLVAGSKYGIHAMHDEHFGMAVAECLRAGCVPFAHAEWRTGGDPGGLAVALQ